MSMIAFFVQVTKSMHDIQAFEVMSDVAGFNKLSVGFFYLNKLTRK